MILPDAIERRRCLAEVQTYPRSHQLQLSESEGKRYDNFILALEMKRDGSSCKEITERTAISPQLLHYYMNRTATHDEHGKRLGHRAFLEKDPSKWKVRSVSLSVLESIEPRANQLTAFFLKHSEVHKAMIGMAVFNRLPGNTESNAPFSIAVIHAAFLELAGEVAEAPYFPFNTMFGRDAGYTALSRWVRRVRVAHQRSLRAAEAARKENDPWLQVGEDQEGSVCYRDVQVDAHSVDLRWKVTSKSADGPKTITTYVDRLWLIVYLESKSTAVLGWSIAFGSNYSGADVARAARCALVPWKRRKLSTTRLSYKVGESLPSAIPELAWMCWDYQHMDNQKGHLSAYYLNTLERGVSCVPVFGPVAAPNVRALIEGLFSLLKQAGFKNVRGQLGYGTDKKKGGVTSDDRFVLDYALLLDFIDILICRYNGACAPDCDVSRVEMLRRSVMHSRRIPRRIPENLREDYLTYDLFDLVTVGRDGARLVVRWKDARYYGACLDRDPDLEGAELVLQAHSQDLRQVRISRARDGQPIGVIDVERRWRSTPHSLVTRRQGTKRSKQSSFIRLAADIPLALRHEQEQLAADGNKGTRSKLARLQIEQVTVSGPDRVSKDGDSDTTPATRSAQVVSLAQGLARPRVAPLDFDAADPDESVGVDLRTRAAIAGLGSADATNKLRPKPRSGS